MKKIIITGLAVLLPLGLALPAFAAVNSHAVEAETHMGASTTTQTTSTTTSPGVHAGSTKHAKRPVLKTVQGTVKAVSADSFTLTVHSMDYTVSATSSTRMVNRVWKSIMLADIQVGDKVRVYGGILGTTVSAKIVRDISLPVVASTTASSTTSH